VRGGRIEKLERDDDGWDGEIRRPDGTEIDLDARGWVVGRDVERDDDD